jgi:hypothetical protein
MWSVSLLIASLFIYPTYTYLAVGFSS